jgi:hypothetical protein
MSSVGNPRRNARKRNPPATRRRALELLAGSRDGCTEAIMLAHGFSVEQMVELVRAGLALRAEWKGQPRGGRPHLRSRPCPARDSYYSIVYSPHRKGTDLFTNRRFPLGCGASEGSSDRHVAKGRL